MGTVEFPKTNEIKKDNEMVIRSFEIDRDFEYISNWISDERTHAM